MKDKIVQLQKIPYISAILVILNVIIFLICTFGGEMLYNIGSISPASFWGKKEYHRLISNMFLHVDIQHLVNNMLLLFGIGSMLEKEIGHVWFFLIYFASGIGADVASLGYKIYCGDWYVESIGASGAVFGLVGMLLAVAICLGSLIPTVTPKKVLFVIAYSVYSGIQNKGIDNAAHIGGVLIGLLFGLIMCFIKRSIIKRGSRRGGFV